MSTLSDELYESIAKSVGEDRVRKDTLERRLYSHDLASLPKVMSLGFKMMPDMVVRPKSAREISEIIKIACKEGIPVVPRGGASWGLGGAMPVVGGIVLDLTGMNSVIDIDSDNMHVTVESGITWKVLYDTLLREGYLIGSYPGSAYSATVGGWINTGGVGVGSFKYGSAIDQIHSLEVVLPTGEIIDGRDTMASGAGGFDLARLFFGAEGTLGIVTKTTLKIYPAPEEIRPFSYAFSDFSALSKAVNGVSRSDITPLHVSFIDRNHLRFLSNIGLGEEDGGELDFLNLALEGDSRVLDAEEMLLNKIMKSNGGKKQATQISEHEWEERFYELRTKRAGPSAILGEAFVPIPNMSSMASDVYELIKNMKLRAAITGMAGGRNTIVFMPYYLTDERKLVKSMLSLSFIKKLGDLGYKHGGRPAGLGLFFTGNVKRMYGAGSDIMMEIKAQMDPYDIMNPGKTLEGLTRYGVPIPAVAMNMGMNVMSWLKHILPKDRGVVV